MEYKNSYTRERLERHVCNSIGREQSLAYSLHAEMDKPKVWDGAPENANRVDLTYWNMPTSSALMGKVDEKIYTRELPKSRAREIAEEAWKKISHYTGETTAIDDIEASILKREAELKEAVK